MREIPKYWLLTAFILHILAAWFSVGHYHDDEYAQILNFATSKIGLDMQSQLMWEFNAGVRSGFQPFFAYLIAKVTSISGLDSPFILSFIYRLLSALISLGASIIFIKAVARQFSSENVLKWTVFFLLFSWILLFLNVRFSSEGWASSFFLLGIGLYLLNSDKKEIKQYLLVGIALGLAFLARYQTGFMLLGFGLWLLFIDRISLKNLSLILIAGIFVLILGAGFDWWLYGKPTISSWEYFRWHFQGMTSASGGISGALHEPWYFYIQYAALQLLPPLTLLLPVAIVAFWIVFPKNPITWVTVPFVLFHQFFGHKEMRYLFPVLPYAPIMFAMVCVFLSNKLACLRNRAISNFWKFILGFSVFANSLLVILVLSLPASKEVALWQNCLTPLSAKESSVLAVLDQDGSYSDPAELNMDFYNENNLPILSVKNETELKQLLPEYEGVQVLYASRKKSRETQLDEASISHQLTCQALPDWILKININNWTSRTSMWRIWSIDS